MVRKISRFDEAAAQWDNNPVRVALARAVGSAINRTVPIQRGWRAVDFGAGTGLLTLNIQPHVESVVALDTSKGMLDQLQQKLAATGIHNVQTRLWNLEQQPLQENGFDLAISSMTLHHLRDVPLVFKRLGNLLNAGGWIACADLDTEDGSFHGKADDVFHHGFERNQIAEWLKQAGFDNISVADAYTVNKPSASGEMRAYPVFLAVARKN